MQIITAEIENGKTYYSTEAKGVEYCANELGGRWVVSSRRLRHGGKVRFFDSLEELCAKVSVFSSLDALVSCEAVS